MSTRDKRREARKLDKARRFAARFRVPRSDIRVGAAALSAAAAIAAGTQAYAAPVRFDNPPGPGHFVWASPPTAPDDPPFLDITQDASVQGPGPGATMLAHYTPYGYVGNFLQLLPEIQVQGGFYLLGVNSGTLIPSGAAWNVYAFSSFGGPSSLPEGVPTYLGVRFDLGAGLQYGWVGVVQSPDLSLDAFAWGYETLPGVPIAAGVPEPGSLALLAVGAVGALTRRKRRT